MPIPVTTRPRFKCQFCLSYRATIKAVEKHEGICWQNPNRFCPECKNTGEVLTDYGLEPQYEHEIPCPYCSKEDKEITASIAKREEKI